MVDHASPQPVRKLEAPSRARSSGAALVAARRRITELEAANLELQARAIQTAGRDFRRSAALNEPEQRLSETIFRTRELLTRIWGGDPPDRLQIPDMTERVRAIVPQLSIQERLNWLDQLTFLANPQVTQLWERLDLLQTLQLADVCNLRVVGEQGSGKTWALFCYSKRINRLACDGELPILYLEAPVAGDGLTQLFGDGLAKMDWPSTGADQSVETRFYTRCIEKHVRIIIIDEAGRLNTPKKRDHLRRLENVLKIPIVAASAEERWFRNDDHLGRRFEPLHRFGPYRGEALLNLMACIEAHLPFVMPSYLDEFDRWEDRDGSPATVLGIASLLAQWTDGRINKIMPIVRSAARVAVVNGHNALTMASLEAGYRNYLAVRGVDS